MKGVGRVMDLEEIAKFIKTIANDQAAKTLTYSQFESFFYGLLVDRVLSSQDNDEYLRDMFREFDSDYSGFLSIEELYSVMLRLKIDMRYEELEALVMEYDMDGNGELDIDEFVELMTGGGDNLNQYDLETQKKFSQLQVGVQQSQFNFSDILKQFANMPDHVVFSFIEEQNIKASDRLRVTIDPSSFMYRDMLPNKNKVDSTNPGSYILGVESAIACEITLEPTVGIPFDEEIKKLGTIVRRAVRIGLLKVGKTDADKKLVFNTAMVTAEWNEREPGEWKFPNAQNPILFRSTAAD